MPDDDKPTLPQLRAYATALRTEIEAAESILNDPDSSGAATEALWQHINAMERLEEVEREIEVLEADNA